MWPLRATNQTSSRSELCEIGACLESEVVSNRNAIWMHNVYINLDAQCIHHAVVVAMAVQYLFTSTGMHGCLNFVLHTSIGSS